MSSNLNNFNDLQTTAIKLPIKMSGHVEIVAILTPVPGKIDEVKISPGPRLKMQYWSANQMELKLIEGLSVLNQYVEANEPDALRYEMFKQTNSKDGAECLVLIET